MKTSSQSPLRYLLLALIRLQGLKTSEQGFIVFFVASIIVLLSLIWVAYGLLSRIDSSSTAASVRSNSGFYAAEYGLNLRAKEIRETFEGYNRPSGIPPANAQACLPNNPGSKGTGDFICKQIDFQDPLYPRDSSAKNPVYTFVQDKTGGTPALEVIPQGEAFAGLTAQAYKYDVVSVAYDLQNQPTANLKITFRNLLIPLFQFAVFSENDAEFSLPPNMTLNGPVHSNKSLYLNARASSTLAINGQVTIVDTLYRGLKYQNSGCSGTVTINSSTNSSIIPTALACGSGSSRQAYATQASVSAWNNKIQVPLTTPLEVPPPDALDPTPGNLYWDRADLRIVLKVRTDGTSVSGVTPTGIEVRNPDNSNNAALTNSLQACTPAFGTISSAADTSIQLAPPTVTALPSGLNGNVPLLVVGSSSNYFDSLVATSFDSAMQRITLRKRLAPTTTLDSGSTLRKAILWSSDTFFNYREKIDSSGNYILSNPSPNAGRYIRMLNVDVQGLIDCANSQNLMAGKALDETTDGGLVWFFTVDDSGPGNPNIARNVVTPPSSQPANNYGIRLYNGSSLSSTNGGPVLKGLTVVSDQAVYIQGNYNLVNKLPAAILSDTINVLSNNWRLDDSNAGRFNTAGELDTVVTGSTVNTMFNSQPLSSNRCIGTNASIGCSAGSPDRAAIATTINAAFLSGLDIPGGANGTATQNNGITSSGVHNYPRFHENWFAPTPVSFRYRGSLVALNVPRRVNSPFCGSFSQLAACNIYEPPNRDWDFDTDFNDAAKLPPLTPRAVYLKQDAFTRNFSISAINSDSIAELFSPTRWLGFSLGLASPQFGLVQPSSR